MKFSANLGFLWKELELCDAIRAAGRAGFDAVEVHWPYITHALDVALALEETGLSMVSLNTVAGDLASGDFGLAAVPGRVQDAHSAIDKAFAYAADVSADWVHVLAGHAAGDEAEETFVKNLRYAAARGREYGVGVLIEPLAEHLHAGYFLTGVDQAAAIIERTAEQNIGILFDCFHASFSVPDLAKSVKEHGQRIGHIQFSSVPDRAEPDHGDVDYAALLVDIESAGYQGFFGAEYHPTFRTDESLAWMAMFQ